MTEKADILSTKIMQGKELHDKFAADIRSKLKINGQTMDYWESRFRLNIAFDNLTPGVCKEIDIQLLEYNQEVAFYHALASAKVQMIKRGSESVYRDKFFALVEEYKQKNLKIPAAATLENLAKVEVDEVESAETIAVVEKQFWSDIIDHLTTCRKIIENATLNNNVEARLMPR